MERFERIEISAQNMAMLIDAFPMPVVLVDVDQNPLHLNHKFTETFGYTLSEIVSIERWWVLAYPDPEYREKVQRSWLAPSEKAHREGTEIAVQTWELQDKWGRPRMCEFRLAPINDDDLGIIIIIRDITHQREIETPSKHTPEHLADILSSLNRGADLVERLLAFSRRKIRPLRVISLQDTLSQIHRMLARLVGDGIDFALELSDEPSWILADSSEIEQVLLNLVVNARDAMNASGKLTITHRLTQRAEGALVELLVSDTGCGLSPEVQRRMFEPFFTTAREGEGNSGLGLSIVYNIVQQSEGFITFDTSEHGTTFHLFFPLAPNPELAQTQPDSSPTPTENKRPTVLLCEDNPMLRSVILDGLRMRGLDVIEAGCVDTALAAFDADPDAIDVVLTDVVMPQRSGVELVEEVLQRKPHMRALFITGYADHHLASRSALTRDVPVLQKPISLRALIAAIESA